MELKRSTFIDWAESTFYETLDDAVKNGVYLENDSVNVEKYWTEKHFLQDEDALLTSGQVGLVCNVSVNRRLPRQHHRRQYLSIVRRYGGQRDLRGGGWPPSQLRWINICYRKALHLRGNVFLGLPRHLRWFVLPHPPPSSISFLFFPFFSSSPFFFFFFSFFFFFFLLLHLICIHDECPLLNRVTRLMFNPQV